MDPANVIKIRELAKGDIDSLKVEWAAIDFEKFDSVAHIGKNATLIGIFGYKVLAITEKIKQEYSGFTSDELYAAAGQILDDVIKLPVYIDALDNGVYPMVIEAGIGYLNSTFGHDWLPKVGDKITKTAYAGQKLEEFLAALKDIGN